MADTITRRNVLKLFSLSALAALTSGCAAKVLGLPTIETAAVPEAIVPCKPDYTNGQLSVYAFQDPAHPKKEVLVAEMGSPINPTIIKLDGRRAEMQVPQIVNGEFHTTLLNYSFDAKGMPRFEKGNTVTGDKSFYLVEPNAFPFDRTNMSEFMAQTVRQQTDVLMFVLQTANGAPAPQSPNQRSAVWKFETDIEGFLKLRNGGYSETTIFTHARDMDVRTTFPTGNYPDIVLSRLPFDTQVGTDRLINRGDLQFRRLAKSATQSGDWGRLFADAERLARQSEEAYKIFPALEGARLAVAHYALSEQRILSGYARKMHGEAAIPYVTINGYVPEGIETKDGKLLPHATLEDVADYFRLSFGLDPADYVGGKKPMAVGMVPHKAINCAAAERLTQFAGGDGLNDTVAENKASNPVRISRRDLFTFAKNGAKPRVS